MNKPKLTNQDFIDAAAGLHCAVACVKAVAEVESRGQGFYDDGFPVILFERHLFHSYTGGKFDKDYPEISNAVSGGYGRAGANQKRKFNIAFGLSPNAAMLACSWGKFQILGSNFKVCGFQNVGTFVDAMKISEGEHLKAFIKFVVGNALDVYLRSRNWKKFAAGYNGRKYREGNYDGKLAAAYEKFKDEKVSPTEAVSNSFAAAVSEHAAEPIAALSANGSADDTDSDTGTEKDGTDTGGDENSQASDNNQTTVLCKERPSTFTRWLTAIKLAVGAAIASVSSYCGGDEIKSQIANKAVEQADPSMISTFAVVMLYCAFGLGTGVLLMWIASKFYDKSANRANAINLNKMDIASNKNLINVELNANKSLPDKTAEQKSE